MSQKRITMTTRSRVSTPTPDGGGIGGGGGGSTRMRGSSSPHTSPARTSRLQEKEELQNLNDRLACYIDRMRNLENENNVLTQEVHVAKETVTREVSNIKSIYEKELAAARKLLDETAKEKAKLEIDVKRLIEAEEDLRARLDKKTRDCAIAENNSRVYESRYNDLNVKYNQALTDRKKFDDLYKEQLAECHRLNKQLDDLRKQLEAETLNRVDLENQNQSLREELSFKDQVHIQELTETRSRRQIDITEIDGRLSKEYEAKLHQSLQELREQYENQMRANRNDIDLLYQYEIKNLQAAVNRANESFSMSTREMHIMRTRIDEQNAKLQELEDNNGKLMTRTRELEDLLDRERTRHGAQVAELDAEMQRLRELMSRQMQDYHDLMDIKVSLDLEIAAYDKLLGNEERRLNITPRPTTNSGLLDSSNYSNGSSYLNVSSSNASSGYRSGRVTPTGRRSTTPGSSSMAMGGLGVKRKRTVIDESEDRHLTDYTVALSTKGDLQILEADVAGRYIKIYNKGTDEINLTGWQLSRIAGDEELAFKFTRGTKILGGQTITIWSVDAGINHEPPNNLVMKKKWPVAEAMRSVLANADKEDVASHDCIRKNTSTHASRQRQNTTGGIGGGGGAGAGAGASSSTGATGQGAERRSASQQFTFGVKNLFSILH